VLGRSKQAAIITHYNPDGDALGSSLGLARVLVNAGISARVIVPNTPPSFLHWMPGYGDVLVFDKQRTACEELIRGSDVLFVLDLNRPDRVGAAEAALSLARVKVVIDHHRDPDGFADILFSDITSPATSQMIVDLATDLSWTQHIDADAATCLYTGIMTDTGSFRFSSTTPHTLEVAAELMRRGAIPDRVFSAIMDDNTEDRMRLLGFALSERMTVRHDLGLAVISLRLEDLGRFNFQPGDTEGLVNYGLAIRGIRLAAFFMERKDLVKISLRSKGLLPVNEFLSAHFQGGGHMNAAGGQSAEKLDDTIARFMREVPGFLARHPSMSV
jgi:bifunctional oligoribonuclease and PAP phosphatase NrnA